MSKLFGFLCAFLFVQSAHSQAQKSLAEVSLADFAEQTQKLAENTGMDLVWWIPPEFWEVSFLQDPMMNAASVESFMESLRGYSMLATLQADISVFGAFTFAGRDAVRDGLTVAYQPSNGKRIRLSMIEQLDPDLELLLSRITPILTAAMGNMGQNMHFFVLDNSGEAAARLVSPYEFGEVQVVLAGRTPESPIELSIELPVDALFVPRTCPNGKEAHVTWNFCPWDGSALSE